MDPNTVLQDIRVSLVKLRPLVEQAFSDLTHAELDSLLHHAGELTDSMDALDTWLSSGGFLPKDWDTNNQH